MADNTQVVRSIEEAWDRNDLDALDQYFAADFDNAQSGTPGLPPGLAGSKMSHQGVMAAFPDRRVTILDLVSAGDTVVVRSRVTGTNRGGAPFLGAPEPNGAKIDFEMWSLYRLRDGRVVAHCGINDGLRGWVSLPSTHARRGPPARSAPPSSRHATILRAMGRSAPGPRRPARPIRSGSDQERPREPALERRRYFPRCELSQKGLLRDRPHRQSVIRFRTS